MMEFTNVMVADTHETNLRQAVLQALNRKGYPHHRALEITTDQGTVIVQGTVPTYYLRQVAVECIKSVNGVKRVLDRIRVVQQCSVESAGDNEANQSPLGSVKLAGDELTQGRETT